MEPELISVRLDSVLDNMSIVEIKYRAEPELDGVELMGVDAELSWLRGESVSLEKTGRKDDYNIYVGFLTVEDSCEFRGRGFQGDVDYWEEGLGNHQLNRTSSGAIQLETHLEEDMYDFWGDLPVNYDPSSEEIDDTFENIEKTSPKLLQTLVNLRYWLQPVFTDPLDENIIHKLPAIQRYLKQQARVYESYAVDLLVGKIIRCLFHMYKSALDFADDDIRLLLGDWEKQECKKTIELIPKEVEKLETMKLGKGKDAEQRFRDLLNYV